MYVCLCHGLNDRQVRSAIEDGGAESAAAVYRHFACAPRCGRCVPFVRDMVKAARNELLGDESGCGRDCVCAEG
jgi:bacterioferritin-associated ferredoxin